MTIHEICTIDLTGLKRMCNHCGLEVDTKRGHRTRQRSAAPSKLMYYHSACWADANMSKPC